MFPDCSFEYHSVLRLFLVLSSFSIAVENIIDHSELQPPSAFMKSPYRLKEDFLFKVTISWALLQIHKISKLHVFRLLRKFRRIMLPGVSPYYVAGRIAILCCRAYRRIMLPGVSPRWEIKRHRQGRMECCYSWKEKLKSSCLSYSEAFNGL